ncbi:MAG TPA: class IV adenylate cyclase [Isosphaeraceae bacterium]|nr:class IV adenylate cyclase [Isosphaeraceae bacterium]
MPTNIEIKCRVHNPDALRAKVERLSDGPVERLEQTDTFFRSHVGRLKLRQEAPREGVLIQYQRPSETGPKASHYQMARTDDPEILRNILSTELGVLGTVRKSRQLYRVGRTRIHLDEVEGLGDFLELEVVLGPEDAVIDGHAEAENLMNRLGIHPDDLIECAYLDLLLELERS